jgi:hypothetical protein
MTTQGVLTRQLFAACKSGDLAKAKKALVDGADPNARNGNGWTAVAEAAVWLRAPVLAALLDAGGDPNSPHPSLSYTPLFRATFTVGCGETVRVLLAKGAAPSLAMEYGWTALHNAAEQGDVEAFEVLVAAGADPSAPGGTKGVPPIASAKNDTVRAALEKLVAKYASTKKQSPAEAKVAAAATRKEAPTPVYEEPAPIDVAKVKGKGKGVAPRALDALEKTLGSPLPAGYREIMERFGQGLLGRRVRVYPPARVTKDLAEWRARVQDYWFWGNDAMFDKKAAKKAVCIADTVDGDEFVYALAQPDTIFMLPNEEERVVLLAKTGLLAALGRVLSRGKKALTFEPF